MSILLGVASCGSRQKSLKLAKKKRYLKSSSKVVEFNTNRKGLYRLCDDFLIAVTRTALELRRLFGQKSPLGRIPVSCLM